MCSGRPVRFFGGPQIHALHARVGSPQRWQKFCGGGLQVLRGTCIRLATLTAYRTPAAESEWGPGCSVSRPMHPAHITTRESVLFGFSWVCLGRCVLPCVGNVLEESGVHGAPCVGARITRIRTIAVPVVFVEPPSLMALNSPAGEHGQFHWHFHSGTLQFHRLCLCSIPQDHPKQIIIKQ